MKLSKTKLKEIVREIMLEDIMDKEIKNPKTGNMVKVRTALQLPDEHPANKKAKDMVAKAGIDKDDVGGPSYPNVKKGAKTSKQAKGVFDKPKKTTVKGPKPDGNWDNDKVMNATIDGDKVGDIIDNEKHPKYDVAMKYVMSFNPDDEKVVSGGGAKIKGPKPGGEFTIDKVMGATIGKDTVGDILDNPKHPNYDKAEKYASQFNPDDEKVISKKPAFVKTPSTGQGYSYDDEPSHADDVESNWEKSSKGFDSIGDKHGVRVDDQSDWSGYENNPQGEYSVSGKNSEDAGDGFSVYSTVETGEDGKTYEGNKNILTFPQDDSPFGGAVEVKFDSIGDAQEALDKILGDKKIKSALDGGRADMANNKDYIKKQLEKLGGKIIRETKMAKLKNILQEVFEDSPKVDKYKVVEGVKNFGIVGKALYNNNNIVEIAKQLSEIAESAHNHILGEQDDWFDKVSVNKNMKSLKGGVVEFQKTAKEAQQLNQRLTALYEDIGHVLNRYYDIDEALDPVGKEDGDIDNDGDKDDSDEYLQKKRDAISKAIKKESKSLKDVGGVVGIPALGDMIKGK